MAAEPIKLIGDILQAELGLKAEQVVLVNQKFDIPSDDRIYIALELLGSRTFGGKTEYTPDPVTGELTESQSVNRQEMISVIMYSRNSDARSRNWEIPAALVSTNAQQVQEANSFKIGYLPTSMVDASEIDGSARLNRFILTFNILVAYKKTKPVDYYDKFATPTVLTNP